MALGYSIKRRGSAGDLAFRVVDITLDTDYPAGGWPLSAQSLGFGSNGTVFFVLTPGVRGGFHYEYDHVNRKLIARDSSGGVGAVTPEAATGLDALNNLVLRVLAFGDGHG